MMVLLVDGRDKTDRPGYIPLTKSVKPLKDKEVQIFVIGTSPNADKKQLSQVAATPEDVLISQPANLPQISHLVINKQFDYLRQTRQPKGMFIVLICMYTFDLF
jgi:hypothetical protein